MQRQRLRVHSRAVGARDGHHAVAPAAHHHLARLGGVAGHVVHDEVRAPHHGAVHHHERRILRRRPGQRECPRPRLGVGQARGKVHDRRHALRSPCRAVSRFFSGGARSEPAASDGTTKASVSPTDTYTDTGYTSGEPADGVDQSSVTVAAAAASRVETSISSIISNSMAGCGLRALTTKTKTSAQGPGRPPTYGAASANVPALSRPHAPPLLLLPLIGLSLLPCTMADFGMANATAPPWGATQITLDVSLRVFAGFSLALSGKAAPAASAR